MSTTPAAQLVEGILWAWGQWRRALPAAPISTVYESETGPSASPHSSQQERYAMEHERELRVEQVVRRQRQAVRRFVWERYVQAASMGLVAKRLHCSRAEAYSIRKETLGIIADAILRGEIPR